MSSMQSPRMATMTIEDKVAIGAEQLTPRVSPVAKDEWVIVGNCWGTTAIPRSELAEFQRGNRDFMVWGFGVPFLLLLAAMLFG